MKKFIPQFLAGSGACVAFLGSILYVSAAIGAPSPATSFEIQPIKKHAPLLQPQKTITSSPILGIELQFEMPDCSDNIPIKGCYHLP